MISSTSSDSSAPCGCGGTHTSASSSGCGCGCGGQCGCGPADCRDGGAIVRPLFFAGQLLTEEDLQALSEYVAAKSRLHNRDFFGEGVACGFEVVCHPCGGGKVIVRPGHALDCCGNDIVLSTAQTLDVNALVRELRKTLQGGIDCGDPCAKPGQDNQRQRYCLFVRYCETRTDPVSAFITDEPCGTAACEPTRVREGLRFELRCREADPPTDALCRIASCLGDSKALKTVIDDLTALDHVIQGAEEGLELERRNPATPVLGDLKESTQNLEKALKPSPTARDVRNVVTRVDVVRVHLDRFNELDPPLPPSTEIKEAGAALDEAKTHLLDHLALGAPTPLEKSFVRKVLEDAQKAINLATKGNRVLWPKDQFKEVLPLDGPLGEMLCSLLKRLLDRLAGSPEVTVCRLRREVHGLGIPCPPQPALEFKTAIDQARRLRDAWWHSLQDCICPALLPPCPECHDLGVQLACLEVESCEVVRICNLERSFVPTPAALRYWLPRHPLHEIAEALCCRDLGHLGLSDLLTKPCPSTVDARDLRAVFTGLWQLVAEHEPQGLPFVPSTVHALLAEPAPATPEKTPSDLAALRHELAAQAAKNADLETRLKALEGRKKS